MLVCSLGNTDEEKFFNIQKIKNTKNKFKKIISIIAIIGTLLMIYATLSGSVIMEDGNKFTTILLFVFLYFCIYIFFGNFYGTGVAWGLYLVSSGVIHILNPNPISTEELVRSYVIGGQEYTDSIVTGNVLSTLFIWAITIVIGFWGGWLNAIIHHKEVKDVMRKMNNKYKSKE